jgi:AraC-like DNA-binding protein
MHTLRFRPASGNLKEFVRAYAQRNLDTAGKMVTELCPARLEQTLEFQFASPFDVFRPDGQSCSAARINIVGAYTFGGSKVTFNGKVDSFAVFFQPSGFSRLFGMPMHELSSRVYDGFSVLSTLVDPLWNRLAEIPSFDERVSLTEEFLLKRAAGRPRQEQGREEQASMHRVADYILAARGAVRITDLAREYGLGARQFERRFLRDVGASPKLYARVARFQTALDLKIAMPQRSWLEIAHDAQYHDQTHMIRDFHELAGDVPGRIVAGIGDVRPTALLPCAPDGETGCVPISEESCISIEAVLTQSSAASTAPETAGDCESGLPDGTS